MKKNRDSDALAARLTAAANQPPVVVAFPATTPPEVEAVAPVPAKSEGAPTTPVEERKRRRRGKAKANAQAEEKPEDETEPMSIRPSRELRRRYVLAAAERTRETGSVVSAQEIMLEVLERGL